MLRRLHHDQPDSFAFTPANQQWAEAQLTKFPTGRQASAIIPLLWRAQEQEGWLTQRAIEHVAEMLDLAYIRALEVATFYFMFQLQPVGSVAHVQICGTLSCMICGAEDLVGLCKEKIAAKPHELSGDGKFSWEEVECLGSCANAPMAQIGKDYYEDLTVESLSHILDEMAAGRVPQPGPQNGRYAAEPAHGLTSLTQYEADKLPQNASAAFALAQGDTIGKIAGTEVPFRAPWQQGPGPDRPVDAAGDVTVAAKPAKAPAKKAAAKPKASKAPPAAAGAAKRAAAPTAPAAEKAPELLKAPRAGGADDLQRITGVGPKLEGVLNDMGFWHFDQIAKWGVSEIAWVDARLKFKGRIERDNWVAQATDFAKE